MSRRVLTMPALVVAAAALAACGGTPSTPPPAAGSPDQGSVVVHSQGSDFVAPIFQEISNLVTGKRITLNYQLDPAVGPFILAHEPAVAFVAGESAKPVPTMPSVRDTSQLYVPVAFGAVALTYNLPEVRRSLRLRGGTLADIFMGRIHNWNARAIAADNPGVALPSTPITIVHRSDPTTSTDLLTQYLSASSGRWRRGPGSGRSVSWPAGTAVSDQNGMLTLVAQTPGAVGYVDQAIALQNHLNTVELRTAAGRYVGPTLPATSLVGLDPPQDAGLSLSTIAVPVPGAYPIATETYVLTFHDLCDAGLSRPEAVATQGVLRYLLGPGQSVVKSLSFAPLPRPLRAKAAAAVRRMQCGGEGL